MRVRALDKLAWWLLSFGKTPETATDTIMYEIYADAYIRELAFMSCVNLVANAVSKCEFVTMQKGEKVKEREYYLWNFEPNQNQNSTAFLHNLIYTLYTENEALVVENGGKLYVADAFTKKEYALYDNVYSQVTVGDFTFLRTFKESEVLHFTLSECDVKSVIDGLYLSYGKLITYGIKGYQKSRGEKGVLELDALATGDPKVVETYEAIRNGGFKKFAEADNALLTMYKGMKYTPQASKTYSNDSTRDIRAMIDDVTDFTARSLAIPPPLLNGTVQDVSSATDQFLTFCIDPLTDNLAEEINRKKYGFSRIRDGTFLRIDTNSIKHIDLLSNATNIDKLVSSGVECINDIRGLLGQPLINEPWAWQHFITKNYTSVDELESLEGGGKK